MEMLVTKCTSCQASVKYAKDKGGRTSKCPKCGTEITLPKDEDAGASANPDDEDGGYSVAFVDEDAERRKREEAQNKKITDKKPKPRIKVRRKNIGDLDAWRKVNAGLIFLLAGACVWGAVYALHALVIFLGLIQGPEFGPNAEKFLPVANQPAVPGIVQDLDRASFFLSLLSGSDFFGTARGLMIVAQILALVQAALWMTGYGLCLSVEDRMGARGQLVFLFCLSGVNVLLNIFLWLLPIVGAIRYVMVPYFAPEIAMHEINTERVVPVHVQWSALPTLEILISIIVSTLNLLEPIMIGVFIWTMAQQLRDDPVEKKAMGLMKMGFGVLFMMLTYHMYAVAGTSSVLIKLLRAIYLIWFGFQVGLIVRLATTCAAARDLLKFYLNPET
jgi:DNA-directed RNA polymerase subunit RPC12/RpoP